MQLSKTHLLLTGNTQKAPRILIVVCSKLWVCHMVVCRQIYPHTHKLSMLASRIKKLALAPLSPLHQMYLVTLFLVPQYHNSLFCHKQFPSWFHPKGDCWRYSTTISKLGTLFLQYPHHYWVFWGQTGLTCWGENHYILPQVRKHVQRSPARNLNLYYWFLNPSF